MFFLTYLPGKMAVKMEIERHNNTTSCNFSGSWYEKHPTLAIQTHPVVCSR